MDAPKLPTRTESPEGPPLAYGHAVDRLRAMQHAGISA